MTSFLSGVSEKLGMQQGQQQQVNQPYASGGSSRKVQDIMCRSVAVINTNTTVLEAARLMAEKNCGVLPILDPAQDKLIGMITDRDIVVRLVAAGKDPNSTRVNDVMTADIKYCFADEDLSHVAQNMAQLKVRRLPVMSREKRLIGIISLGDFAKANLTQETMTAVKGVSQPGGPKEQTVQEIRR